MRQRLLVLGYLAIFWLIFEIAIRALFLVYNNDLTAQLTAGEIFQVFLHGLKMDISMIGYFIMASGLILTVSMFTKNRWPYFALNTLHIFLIIASSLLATIDIELYRHWGFRLNTAPLFYVQHTGSAAMGSVAISVVFELLLIATLVITIFLFLYDRFMLPRIRGLQPGKRAGFAVLLVVSLAMFLPIRGSFTVAPMNTGFVYFHKTKAYANHAAINVTWNFLYNLSRNTRLKYPENFLPDRVAEEHFRQLYPTDEKASPRLWKTDKPNIILFILESFTADVIEPLGGLPDIAPNLNKLCDDGILFTNFYASGDRTDKGLVSLLSGYPAQPLTSIIKNPAKTQRLPYLNHYMLRLGYKTSFIYGGDVDFANFRSYLTNSRFDNITSEEDFPDELNESKWGVHDHIVFQRALQECDTTRNPFFKVILSLSSHEPFDVPMVPKISGDDEESLFLNSCYYTDQSIGEFIVKAKTSPWWDNTVIIFVADHGHRSPGKKEIKDRERYHIPLLMIGGAIKGDTVINKYAGQTDLANTLLGQLGRPSAAFTFSKDIVAPSSKSFATYFFNDGYGFVTDDEYIIFDNIGKQFLRRDGADDGDLDRSRAYEQILFVDYNNK
ncbi:MAG: sulfatase-like hydrolase/transferase [Bacteroidota bacterium]|nr:sulfatase-like hydrolase/transferase [Bacteroidota bacterium]